MTKRLLKGKRVYLRKPTVKDFDELVALDESRDYERRGYLSKVGNQIKLIKKEKFMRIALLMIVMLFINCNKFELPALSKVDDKKKIAEAQTKKVIENLQKKPEWLFTDNACPADIMPEVEKKIEYKAAGCADNPDKCLEKCRTDDANACYALSLLLDEQRGKEEADTQALYLRACKLGIISGCTNNAAGKLNIASKDEKIAKCAADTFEKTCLKDDSWGCTMYGEVLAMGSGRPENVEEALKYFQKACVKFGELHPLVSRHAKQKN